MPATTLLEIPAPTQAQMLAELRHVRYGYLLSLHILLLCARGKSPTEIAEFLCCSRSSVYRTVEAYRKGKLRVPAEVGAAAEPPAARVVLGSLKRTLVSLVKCVPQSLGWCRTRWSCATLALELKARRGTRVSHETIRQWLHAPGI